MREGSPYLGLDDSLADIAGMTTAKRQPVIVVLSGAGISRESGLQTFRDGDGLWEGHDVMQVATPEAWAANPALVLEFYNQRRRQLDEVQPHAAHRALADLESWFDVRIVTQNVDDLHERSGSSHVLHLHGELRLVRPEDDPGFHDERLIRVGEAECRGPDVVLGDLDERGVQLRPHVVWFGEPVPMMERASETVSQADELLVVGTSMQVYPAAGLVNDAQRGCRISMVNPDLESAKGHRYNLDQFYCAPASEGVSTWAFELSRRWGVNQG